MTRAADSTSELIDRLRSGLGGDVAVAAMADRRIEVTATADGPVDPSALPDFLPLDRHQPHRIFARWVEASGTWIIVTILDPEGASDAGPPAGPDRALPGRGMVVAVLGPDGAGKTTALAALGASYVRPIRYAKLRLRSIRGVGPFRWLRELGRITRLGLVTRMARRRGEIVAWDRHPLEDRLPWPTRRVVAPEWQWLAPIIPDPDVVVVLDAPVEVLMARRPEENEAALRQVRARYRSWSESNPHANLIDATAEHAKVVQRITTVVWAAEVAATLDSNGAAPQTRDALR